MTPRVAGDRLVTRARVLASSTWSDALDRLGLNGVMRGLSWRAGGSPIVGRAVTVREEVGTLSQFAVDDFDMGRILRAAATDDVLVIDMGGAAVSTFGGLAARAAIARGIAGVVIDGACRDLEEIRASTMRLWSRHVAPTSGKGRVRLAELNAPITCGGVTVYPGDVIVADETGVIAIPAQHFADALEIAEELGAHDRRFEAALASGADFGAVVKSLGHA